MSSRDLNHWPPLGLGHGWFKLWCDLFIQNGRHFADDISKCIFLNENVSIGIKISLKFVTKGPIYSMPALVQTLAWHRPGYKRLSEPMMVSLPTYICVTPPQRVNQIPQQL